MFHNNQLDNTTIVQYVTKVYIQNNYTLLGVFYSLAELATILKIPDSVLQAYINKYYETWEITNGMDSYDAMARGVGKMALFGALESAHMARKQLLTLDLSQNGQYQPFISSEVNKAIKNTMDGWSTVANLAEKLQPRGPSIQILNQNNQATQVHATITPTEAMKIVEAKMKDNPVFQVGSSAHVEYLLASPNLATSDIPEVVATMAGEAAVAAKVAKKKRAIEEEELSAQEAKDLEFIQSQILDEEEDTSTEQPAKATIVTFGMA